eukprot:11107544-Lingulodinium_polyedra.AAC.1
MGNPILALDNPPSHGGLPPQCDGRGRRETLADNLHPIGLPILTCPCGQCAGIPKRSTAT